MKKLRLFIWATSMPISSAVSRSPAVARAAMPSLVRIKKKVNIPVTAKPMRKIATRSGTRRTPPTSTTSLPNTLGKENPPRPQTICAPFSMKKERPIVDTTAASTPRR